MENMRERLMRAPLIKDRAEWEATESKIELWFERKGIARGTIEDPSHLLQCGCCPGVFTQTEYRSHKQGKSRCKDKFIKLKVAKSFYKCPVQGCKESLYQKRVLLIEHFIYHSRVELEAANIKPETVFDKDKLQIFKIKEHQRNIIEHPNVFEKFMNELAQDAQEEMSDGEPEEYRFVAPRKYNVEKFISNQSEEVAKMNQLEPFQLSLEISSIKRESKKLNLLVETPPYEKINNQKVLCNSIQFSSEALVLSKKLIASMWQGFKMLTHLKKLNLAHTDSLLGVKLDYGNVTLYTRPYDKTLDYLMDSMPCEEITKLAIVGAYQAVADIHSKGIIHRDLKPENISVVYLNSTSIFLRNFESASSNEDEDTGTTGNKSVFFPSHKKWKGGSANIDLYSLGMISLAFHVGHTEFKKAITKKKNMEAYAKQINENPSTPTELKKILEGTILAEDGCKSIKDLCAHAYNHYRVVKTSRKT